MIWKLDRVFIPVVLRHQTIMKSPSLSVQAERKHILFNRKRKIETGLVVFRGSMLWQKVHYGIFDLDFWLLLPPFFFKIQYILSVCHFKKNMCECPSLSCLLLSNSLLEKDLVFQRCTVSSADWAVSTCSPRWVQALSCSRASPLLSLQQHNDFSRHVAKRLFTLEF